MIRINWSSSCRELPAFILRPLWLFKHPSIHPTIHGPANFVQADKQLFLSPSFSY